MGKHPDQARRRLLLCEKLNGAETPMGRSFVIGAPTRGIVESIVSTLPTDWPSADRLLFSEQLALAQEWEETDLDTSDMVAEPILDVRQISDETEKAASWLKRYLTAGPCAAASCVDTGNDDCEMSHPSNGGGTRSSRAGSTAGLRRVAVSPPAGSGDSRASPSPPHLSKSPKKCKNPNKPICP